MTDDMKTALEALRRSAETDNGDGTWDVYLDNARPADWSGHKWAGVLSALRRAGYYQHNDDPDFMNMWGSVRMLDAE